MVIDLKKEEKTKITRDKIVRSAVELFGSIGYKNFTINTLCREYGISKGLLYHNFSGKDELFLESVRICYQRLLKYLRSKDNIPSIEEYIILRVDFFRENDDLANIFFDSLIQVDHAVYEEVSKIREELIDFNKKVYLNLISGISLKEGIEVEDALEYFDIVQEMINSYYISPAIRNKSIEDLKNTHETTLNKFMKYFIFGVAK